MMPVKIKFRKLLRPWFLKSSLTKKRKIRIQAYVGIISHLHEDE